MTKTRAIECVSEALSYGIVIQHKGLNGDAVRIGTYSAKYAKHKRFVTQEYYMSHSFGHFTSTDKQDIAKWAVEQVGSKLGLVAERQCVSFLLNVSKQTS